MAPEDEGTDTEPEPNTEPNSERETDDGDDDGGTDEGNSDGLNDADYPSASQSFFKLIKIRLPKRKFMIRPAGSNPFH